MSQFHPAISIPRLPAGVSFHVIGEEGVVFDSHRQMLFSASILDTFLLCCLEESMSSDEIIAELRARAGLTPLEALDYLEEAIETWESAGLFRHPGEPHVPVASVDAPKDAAVQGPGCGRPAGFHASAQLGPYGMLDTRFTVSLSEREDAAGVARLLRHLETGGGSADCVHLHVSAYTGGFAIRVNGQQHGTCRRRDQIPLMVLSAICYVAVHESCAICAVHAAAAEVEEGCILMPAASGSGKSTLLAGLAASGMTPLCDDTAVISPGTFELRPLRSGISLKQGSWEVLAESFPSLFLWPAYLRPDDRLVRFVPPAAPGTAQRQAEGDRYPVRAMVFPRYEANGEAVVEELDASQVLKELGASFYLLNRSLSSNDLQHLIDWLEDIPSYRIRYPSLDAGVNLVRALCP